MQAIIKRDLIICYPPQLEQRADFWGGEGCADSPSMEARAELSRKITEPPRSGDKRWLC